MTFVWNRPQLRLSTGKSQNCLALDTSFPDDQALVDLVEELRDCGYHFATVTPLTQARVNARANNAQATDLAGVFGWSRAFDDSLLPPRVIGLMRAAKVIAADDGGGWRSLVRVSTIGTQLFVHSSYPTRRCGLSFFWTGYGPFCRSHSPPLSGTGCTATTCSRYWLRSRSWRHRRRGGCARCRRDAVGHQRHSSAVCPHQRRSKWSGSPGGPE